MLKIDRNKGQSLYEQLYMELKRQIAGGQLRAGHRLTPTRTLAMQQGISRNTVISAYRQLEVEGFVRGVIGSGYYVNQLPDYQLTGAAGPPVFPKPVPPPAPPKHDFAYGSIDLNVYRTRGFKRALQHALAEAEGEGALVYTGPQGEHRLLQAMAHYLRASRGVHTAPERIFLSGGHHYSCLWLAELFAGQGYAFAMEEPGYPGTRQVFEQAAYRMHPIPLGTDGICLDALKGLQRVLLYLTPSHQFPMGRVLPIAKRIELLQWAQASGSYIIEDDYDSELRYSDMTIPSLQSIDRQGRVIYLGTLSKAVSPDLRLSYVVFPQRLPGELSRRYPYFSCPVPGLMQKTLAHYIESGQFSRHLNTIRLNTRRKHDLIVKYFRDHFPDSIQVHGTGGGMHFVLQLRTGLPEDRIIQHFAARQVGVYPVSTTWMRPENSPPNQVLMGYGGIPLERLPAALAAFGQAMRALP